MNETIRYRIIGAMVILCFIALLAPIVLKQRAIVLAERENTTFYYPTAPEQNNESTDTEWEKPLSVAHVTLDKNEKSKVGFISETQTSKSETNKSSQEASLNKARNNKSKVGKKNRSSQKVAFTEKKGPTPVKNQAKMSKNDKNYSVQLAAFRNQFYAKKLKKNLESLGYSAIVTTVQARDRRKMIFVFVGELNNKKQAYDLQQQLLAKTQLQGMVVRR